MKGIDRLEGEHAAMKIALLALIVAHPKPVLIAEGIEHMRQMQQASGLFSTMSDDGLQACDDLLRLLSKIGPGSAAT